MVRNTIAYHIGYCEIHTKYQIMMHNNLSGPISSTGTLICLVGLHHGNGWTLTGGRKLSITTAKVGALRKHNQD